MNLLLFISIAAPLSMVLFVCDGKSRRLILFLLCGILACLFCGELNTILYRLLPVTKRYFTVNISPLAEDAVKAVPVLLYAFTCAPRRKDLLEGAVAVGVGFAILENAFVLAESSGSVSLPLALARGFGSGMMHGICTFLLGVGMSFVHTKRKLFFPGTLALLSFAAIYHGIYNDLMLSRYQWAGLVLPLLSFVPLMLYMKKKGLL